MGRVLENEKGPNNIQIPELEWTEMLRVCSIVEFETPQGIFLPLLVNRRREEIEIAGGETEGDIEDINRSMQLWLEYNKLAFAAFTGSYGVLIDYDVFPSKTYDELLDEILTTKKVKNF